jgi:hypothetical protein
LYISTSWLSLLANFVGELIKICIFLPMTFPFCDPDHIIGTFFSTDIYMSRGKPDSGPMHGDVSMFLNANDNGFVGNLNSFGNQPLSKEESVSFSASSEPSRHWVKSMH